MASGPVDSGVDRRKIEREELRGVMLDGVLPRGSRSSAGVD
jgi:hypothetical protein